MRMFAVECRGVPATVAALVSDGEEQAGRELAKALERAVSGRTGAAPSRSFRSAARVAGASTQRAHPARAVARAPCSMHRHTDEGAGAQIRPKPQDGRRSASSAGGVAHDSTMCSQPSSLFPTSCCRRTGRPTLLPRHHKHQSSANRAAGLVRQCSPSARQTLQAEVMGWAEGADRSLWPSSTGDGREDRAQDPVGARSLVLRATDAVRAGDHQPCRQNARDAMPDGAASPSARATSASARA